MIKRPNAIMFVKSVQNKQYIFVYVYAPVIPDIIKNMSEEELKKLTKHLKSLTEKESPKSFYGEIKTPEA